MMIYANIADTRIPCELVGIRPNGDGWVAESDDPQMIFKPAKPLVPGWYRISVSVKSENHTSTPQIYFDTGSGFSETLSARLRRGPNADQFYLDVRLPFPAVLARLDPADVPGELEISAIRVRRLSTAELGFRLARHGFDVMRQNPAEFMRRLPVYVDALSNPLFLRLTETTGATGNSRGSYEAWIKRHDFNPETHTDEIKRKIDNLSEQTLISVVMPVFNTPKALLIEAIESVRQQIYPNWELCIADDRSTKPHVRRVLQRYAALDPRIKVVYRQENGHISQATNSAFALAEGTWIALLDHDDILRPHALAEVALEIARHPETQMIYSDEDKLDKRGRRYDPYFKPDFSRELFRSQNYLNHLTVHRAENIRVVGGWRPGYEGSQDYDLSLRIFERVNRSTIRHIPKILYHWRAAKGSTAASGSEKNYAFKAGMRALEDHVSRMKLPAVVEEAPNAPFYRLHFSLPKRAPLVSLIVPTRDNVELLRGSVGTILEKTDYPNYEIIIVDNGSVEKETLTYFDELNARRNVRILRYDRPFNYSAINNFAVAKAKGSVVGLINNDIEVISPGWLTEMVSWAIQPDIGCVGAKLYFGNDTVQHAGIILGIGGVAGHSHKYYPRNHHGYFSRLKLLQNVSGVTAACLVVRKGIFVEVGGLNETNLAVAFNDVDFCLKVSRAGYNNVWTPYAELYHLESVSRGMDEIGEKRERFVSEVTYMKNCWKRELASDPYYSPHLTRYREDFSIAV